MVASEQFKNWMDMILAPLRAALEEHPKREDVWREVEYDGVLTWIGKTGYITWVAGHPGCIPSVEQIEVWRAKAQE